MENIFNNKNKTSEEKNIFLKNLESNVIDRKKALENYNKIINKDNK